mmetsp:Transcript_46421/g.116368  ORF Transcript_46421/g.116368 Transcript_46421/m.116368 type:complete len:245 (-) Transcript_46421:24-758(-)
MGVLATRTLAFSRRLGWPTPIFLSRMKPSERNESFIDPPHFLIIWMFSRLPLPLRRRMASTHMLANWSCSLCTILEERVVLAILKRTLRKPSGSDVKSQAISSSFLRAAPTARRHPWMMVWGWMRWERRGSASARRDPARMHTVVVPSPTSSSCVLEMSTRILAAGLSSVRRLRMVAPSLVTVTSPVWLWRILSMPLGPRVDFTRSLTAMAPMTTDILASEPLKFMAPWPSTDGPPIPSMVSIS